MFAGTDMAGLRNSVRDFRKLSFMGDLDFVYIDREPKHCMIDYYFGRISCCAKIFAEMTGRHLEEVILIFADMDNVDPKRFSKLDIATVTANHYDFNAGKMFKIFELPGVRTTEFGTLFFEIFRNFSQKVLTCVMYIHNR